MTDRPFVFLIGQFPPPVTGFALITLRMMEMARRNCNVRYADISPGVYKRISVKHLRRIWRTFVAALRLICGTLTPRRICYLACEGDLGLVYTIILAFVARTCGYSIYLHHHSYSYLNKPRHLISLLLAAGGNNLTHIFLCSAMRDIFARLYDHQNSSLILSNSAFVEPRLERFLPRPIGHTLTIGLLSNLTAEKGLHLFLELIRKMRKSSTGVIGVLAGPILNAEDAIAVTAAQFELGPSLEYRGPLYSESKQKFYNDIDVFVFPTLYANEAQPTVLFEAMANGVAVLSFERGCITSQIAQGGVALSQQCDFVSEAIKFLSQVDLTPSVLCARRNKLARTYKNIHLLSVQSARQLFSSTDTEDAIDMSRTRLP